MKTVEVSQSALESLQKMVEQMQERNEELLRALNVAADLLDQRSMGLGFASRAVIAKCTAKQEVLE